MAPSEGGERGCDGGLTVKPQRGGDALLRRWGPLACVLLFVITALSRLPFRSSILYPWDSVNYAFGMRRFDVLAEQPQPPGYIVYVCWPGWSTR